MDACVYIFGSCHTVLDHAYGIEQVGNEQVVDDKARRVLGDDHCLPSACAELTEGLDVSSLVCRARTNSTSFITGTGLKKWAPATRSGLR